MAAFLEKSTCAIALLANCVCHLFFLYHRACWHIFCSEIALFSEVENAALKNWKLRSAMLGLLIHCEKKVILCRIRGLHIQVKNDFVQIIWLRGKLMKNKARRKCIIHPAHVDVTKWSLWWMSVVSSIISYQIRNIKLGMRLEGSAWMKGVLYREVE